MTEGEPVGERFSFASLHGIHFMSIYFQHTGAACPECGHGTRVTSKRWARCKQCNARVARRPWIDLEDAIALLPEKPVVDLASGAPQGEKE